jgi:hypothetical protein
MATIAASSAVFHQKSKLFRAIFSSSVWGT